MTASRAAGQVVARLRREAAGVARFLSRLAKDERIPRWLRRAIVVCAVVPVPGPFDELAVVVLLVPVIVFHRHVVAEQWSGRMVS